MTLAQLYEEASRQGVTVTNLFSLTPEIYGCRLDGRNETPVNRWGYAQGTTPAEALQRAIETLKRTK